MLILVIFLVLFLSVSIGIIVVSILLKSAFDVPWFLIGDFNETLFTSDCNSKFLNLAGSNSFILSLQNCDLIEFPLVG